MASPRLIGLDYALLPPLRIFLDAERTVAPLRLEEVRPQCLWLEEIAVGVDDNSP